MKKRIAFILISVFLFVSCDKGSENKVNKKVLNLAITSDISTLDPVSSYDGVSGSITYNIYEQLYEYHYLNRPYELRPLLAEGMPLIENQGRRYVIKIKKNIRYHDHPAFLGNARYVTSQDFVTQIKRLAFTPLNSTGWWIVDGVIEGINDFKKISGNDFAKFKSTGISGIQTPDAQTIVINLIRPSPQFIYKLAMSFVSPVPIEVVEFEKNHLDIRAVGTGPFYLTPSDFKTEISLAKFPYYHESFYPAEGDRFANNRGLLKDAGEKIPFISSLVFKVVKDYHARWELFLKRKLDIIVLPHEIYNLVFDDVGNLKEEIKIKNIRLQTVPTLTYWWLAFNMRDPILGKNLYLRKAIAHAINMDRYIQIFTNNTGQRSNSMLPPGIFGYNPSSTLPYSYDPVRARDFLTKAGFPNGKNLPEFIYDTREETKISLDQANFFKQELAQIGIKLKVVPNDFKQFLEKSRTGRLQFFQDGWTLDYPDAENVFQLLTSVNYPPGPNASFYTNKNIDIMYQKLSNLPDGTEKKNLIKKMESIIQNDLPWIMQSYARNFILYHDSVKNFRQSDLLGNYPKYIRLK
jgi:ABC-type transport system substrate-binding protein